MQLFLLSYIVELLMELLLLNGPGELILLALEILSYLLLIILLYFSGPDFFFKQKQHLWVF